MINVSTVSSLVANTDTQILQAKDDLLCKIKSILISNYGEPTDAEEEATSGDGNAVVQLKIKNESGDVLSNSSFTIGTYSDTSFSSAIQLENLYISEEMILSIESTKTNVSVFVSHDGNVV